ncbi:MAG: flavocytochrome c [Blautia sp.]|nr:flavocytochrome c [Blautia sp.]
MEAQSLDVDGVSGATISSTAIKTAVTNALADAGLTPEDLEGAGSAPAESAEATTEAADEGDTASGATAEAADATSSATAETEADATSSATSETVADTTSGATQEGGDAAAANSAPATGTTYTAEVDGFGGKIIADVTIDGNTITALNVTGDSETEGLGSVAVEKLPDKIVEAQSLEVDGVSGASVSSNAIKTAVTEALAEAGLTPEDLESVDVSAESAEKTEETLDVDVVVVGGGGAGMAAAITANQAGKNVIILEKMPYLGGNTTKATGGMNAAETHYQDEQGIEDSVEQFVEDTMEGGHQINDIDLVTTMAEKSAEAIDWLDSIDAPLPKVSFSGGATNSRIHSPEDGSGVGEYLVAAFSKQLDALQIPVYFETEATEIIMDGGKAVGVKAVSEKTDYTINAGAVILATGGFGANEEMYCSYRPDLKGTVTTNAPGATGDGIVMAEAVGAGLVDIDQIQLHPTVEQSTSMLITEGVRGDGAILVNQSGKRFTNELLTRDKVSAAELEQEGSYAYVIFDQNLRDNLAAIEKYVKNNIVVEAPTIEELAEALEIDPATLAETLNTWNEAVKNGKDEEFGRDTGMEHDLSVAPYYAIKIAPGIHHTMGGVRIDTETEVLTDEGEVIPGLFAAGEVCGGVHGGNRIGGNAVADIVVFGRIAGDSACSYIDAQ